MSHRIVDDNVAVRFSKDELRAQFDYYAFYHDYVILFELGGDNNLFGRHPQTGREVRCRSWSTLAVGADWEVMREAVRFAVCCEGGGMRFNGSSSTMPETYIRRCRDVVANAVPFEHAGLLGLSLTAKIQCGPAGERMKHSQDDLAELIALQPPTAVNGKLEWIFHPLLSMRDAALFFAFRHFDDERSIWNVAKADGPQFEMQSLRDRARVMAKHTAQGPAVERKRPSRPMQQGFLHGLV
ncbi:MAG: hypothetical protein F8N36_12115 [Desulfovibrio sp.]|uniref:hypothetical protein n=1 Tax=Desulfovibrio sp. TaxID=885 RepID=UPI00135E63DA|nr:hypothetical protein [Desulfovibrio sp.]MTJ93593.1 hypothetical protein [Desulfovibrio sp.]